MLHAAMANCETAAPRLHMLRAEASTARIHVICVTDPAALCPNCAGGTYIHVYKVCKAPLCCMAQTSPADTETSTFLPDALADTLMLLPRLDVGASVTLHSTMHRNPT